MRKFFEKVGVLIYTLILWTMNACGCNPFVDIGKQDNDLVFVNKDNHYAFLEFTENAEQETYYIPDEFNGKPVKHLGGRQTAVEHYASFLGNNLKTVYVPWSVTSLYRYVRAKDNLTIISATMEIIPAERGSVAIYDIPVRSGENVRYIIPNTLYYGISEDGVFLSNGNEEKVGNELLEICLPANVAYFFNYEGEPNKGYFFVDLLEETGKLTKPPYDPKREGYSFGGWYKDAECTESFDFEKDEVAINLDEEGNRIYEEFCLYAKWIK